MKKIIVFVVAVMMLATVFVGCTKEEPEATKAPAAEKTDAPEATEAPVDATEEPTVEGYEIAMITDIGDIDDKSFNQGTWDGIVDYADANGITRKYYKPTEKTTDAYVSAIDLAVQGGAKIIVTPGFLFEPAIYIAQELYPEVKFVLIDGSPNDGDWSTGFPTYRIDANVYSIIFSEEQVGFLAGYAAVKDGYTKLGYLGGMAVPAVVRYGYGFVQGAEYAAAEMGLESLELMYNYTGNFDATPDNQAMAASWYGSGTEVIFAAGGKVGNSAMAAAESAGGNVIGVDVDQSSESDTVITSARKELGVMVKAALTDFYADTFKGGVSEILGIRVDAVGLEMINSKFETFSQADYDMLKAALVADTDGIRSNILKDAVDTTPVLITDIPLEIVVLTYVE